jgi:hypothetical protein
MPMVLVLTKGMKWSLAFTTSNAGEKNLHMNC